ncbi:glycoside hydrolase family 55 protein [Chryseobacterium oryctis]|uniref:Glycoside hydrolase family 55 protein n=1 Tax=Chryseobacterium oryctis TaxID=2952618 RepID=A0ABT3HMY4_9FLAO|nr:glycoside hydrolase family 55 protein [Chryseobacterium oryctis]MCW3161119.1 glycoside hydrolase family 55 protein [Chryseobacterium oryctis]
MSTKQIQDPQTGEVISLIPVTKWYDGTIMTDSKCDEIIYFKGTIEDPDLYYKRYIEDHINVKWFGAVGDGVHDDTINIQSAFNFLLSMRDVRENSNSSCNLCCFIPDGKYKISSMLLFPTSCTLKGASENGTILFTERNDIAVLFPTYDGTAFNTHDNPKVDIYRKNKEYTIIRDLTIGGNFYKVDPYGDRPAVSNSFGKGILLDKMVKVCIQNVAIDGFETAGIHCNESYYTCISDTILINNRIGLLTTKAPIATTSVSAVNTEIRLNSTGIIMTDSYGGYFTNCLVETNIANYSDTIDFSQSPDSSKSIAVTLKNCQNINFSNCYFEAHLVTIVLYSSQSNVFSNCFFAPAAGIFMEGALISPYLVWFYGNNASDNKFINNYYLSSDTTETLSPAHKFFTHYRNTSSGNVFELTTKDQLDKFISQNQNEFDEFINNNWKENAPKFICDGSNEQFVDVERRYIIDKTFGITSERPTTNLYKGQHYFDSTIGMPIYWQGSQWVKPDGTLA